MTWIGRLKSSLRREKDALAQAEADDAAYRGRQGDEEADRLLRARRAAVKRAETWLRKAEEKSE